MNNGWMEVKIFSLKNGYEYYDKVKSNTNQKQRIQSSNYERLHATHWKN